MPRTGSAADAWDFKAASTGTLEYLRTQYPAATWFIARHLEEGDVLLSVAGEGSEELSGVAGSHLAECAALAVPLVDHRRSTFGILGAVAADEDALIATAGVVDFHASLLSSVLAAELRAEEERRRAERAEFVAMIDPLTAAANRRGWEALLAAEEARCQRYGDPVAILVVSLDALGRVNDTYGTASGDEVLRLATQVLEGCLREPDAVARLSGNDFGILVIDCDQPAVDRLAVRIEASLLDNGITATVGAAVRGLHNRSLLEAWRAAEVAHAEARRERLRLRREHGLRHDRLLVTPTPWVIDPAEPRPPLQVVSPEALTVALDGGQFRLYLQAVVSLADEAVRGAEALLRWQHPSRGLLGPAEFLAVAEQAGVITPIGHWVVAEACAVARRLLDSGLVADPAGGFSVAANVSVHQLEDPAFAEHVVETLVRSRLEPRRLHLEVTETLPIGDSLALNTNLATLRACGVVVALDDFGTRYATLETLMRTPLDIVKIDKVFVDRVHVDPVARGLVAAVVDLCSTIGMDVVAEGIELPEQAEVLRELGCPFGQGYLFGRPTPVEQFLADPALVS